MTVPVPGDAPLISRRVFLGNPDKASPQISPDGAWLSWLAPVDGVLNVWLAPAEKPAEARPVTRDTGRGVRLYSWTYPDEGHGFARPENNLPFFAVTEAFLASCLGGRYEPAGDDLAGSSITVSAGAESVPGLQEALGRMDVE